MATGEIACTYACLVLHDDGIPVTAEKISALVKAANVRVESYWPSLFAKLLEKKSIEDLIVNVGSGGGAPPVAVSASALATPAPAAAEETKGDLNEESDEDMVINLFD